MISVSGLAVYCSCLIKTIGYCMPKGKKPKILAENFEFAPPPYVLCLGFLFGVDVVIWG